MSDTNTGKAAIRKRLREILAGMTDQQRHAKSVAACALITSSREFASAGTIMLYLSSPQEVDTSPLALRAWQTGKTVVVPKVNWNQRHMLPVEITSLHSDITTSGIGVREPVGGKPVPINLIDMVIVPGLGFSTTGQRIGRGMGFYDRFLAIPEFLGLSCGLGFEEQVIEQLPTLDHDMPLSMLVTDTGIRRFASNCIENK
ncbi:MAG TPA: 5-formyltetrahydrofolate cyclo-ligase [Tepidisphaeraceae bacterium]|nr:5-formyltetrahydrofolate cyclo-ligase [Tepidisphaeraceae bacterium]